MPRWVGNVKPRGIVGYIGERERWIAIGGVCGPEEGDAPGPAEYADVEVEDRAGVAAGEENRDDRDCCQSDECNQRIARQIRCGITSNHLTSQSQELTPGKSSPST